MCRTNAGTGLCARRVIYRSRWWKERGGGLTSWTRLNKKLKGSFDDAVAADFDGNGRTDIAFNDGRDWRFTP